MSDLLLGGSWGYVGHFSLFFRILGPFWSQLEPSCDFFEFFYDLFNFPLILDEFWDDLGVFFR